jgi:hypothetical protein
MNDQAVAMAQEAISNGRVERMPDARTYTVHGRTGTYMTTVDTQASSCTCEAGRQDRLCWHVVAVGLLHQDQAMRSARQQAFDEAQTALANLVSVCEDELPDHEICGLLEAACDRFDVAEHLHNEIEQEG